MLLSIWSVSGWSRYLVRYLILDMLVFTKLISICISRLNKQDGFHQSGWQHPLRVTIEQRKRKTRGRTSWLSLLKQGYTFAASLDISGSWAVRSELWLDHWLPRSPAERASLPLCPHKPVLQRNRPSIIST